MRKKRGKKQMAPSTIVSLAEKRGLKSDQQYTKVKPLKKLTPEQMRSSSLKRRRED